MDNYVLLNGFSEGDQLLYTCIWKYKFSLGLYWENELDETNLSK